MKHKKANKLATGARYVLGALLVLSGLNGFFQFMPFPKMADPAMALMGAFAATGYMMVAITLLQLVPGLMLLANKYTALALVLLTPLTVNIILFHIFLDLSAIGPGLVLFLLNVYLLWVNLDTYKDMLSA